MIILSHTGGFAGNIGHDPHILYTLSAVQVLALFNKLDVLDTHKVAACILSYILLMKLFALCWRVSYFVW